MIQPISNIGHGVTAVESKTLKMVNNMSQVESSHETGQSQMDVTAGRDNFDFVQVSRQYMKQMRQLARKSPVAHELLYYFVEHMGKTTNAVIVSYATLMEITGVSRPTVGRAIKTLKDDNWVDTIKVGNATAYCVNARAFWQAARNQKHYAKFQATVIASESDQESNFREKAKMPINHIPIVGKAERIRAGGDELPPPDQQDLDLD